MVSTKIVRIAAIGVFLLGMLTVLFLLPATYPEVSTIAEGAATFRELSDRFVALAEAKGASYAFEVLKRAELPPDTDFHLLGHAVGDVLYGQKGVAGIADCTQEFRNACSHAVVIGTLNDFGAGDTTLRMIDDACKKAPGGSGAYTMCYHGLGHGVFAYFRYDIPKTVAFCKQMGTREYKEEQFAQCVGGAIMELTGGGGHDHDLWLLAREKYLSSKNPLSPCETSLIPDRAAYFCLLYITPQLLALAGADAGHPDPATFPKAFSFCGRIPKSRQSSRDACFGGFGKEFIPLAGARDIRAVDRFSDEQYKEAISWCELAAAPDGKRACIDQALGSVFWGGENDARASVRFCSLVSDDTLRTFCYTSLAENISRYTPDRAEVCALLPAEYQTGCPLGTLPSTLRQ
ncbi:hypothetical protein HY971_02145 [Candidatus Kaiserbacteria bacterium]|nr:hypothetical protein [Candidatus Kaiserbacteria bacterium]